MLLLNDPTRGIDVGAKRDLYGLLTQLADEGVAVVMLSIELDEHVELMDRVLVFREHELFREIQRDVALAAGAALRLLRRGATMSLHEADGASGVSAMSTAARPRHGAAAAAQPLQLRVRAACSRSRCWRQR